MASNTGAKPRVGFIGLGSMGVRMAGRLLDAGYPLTVYNRTASKAGPLRARGAAVAPTPAELARQADFVFSIVADDAAVEDLYFGPDGVLSAARPGTILSDLSTIQPRTANLLEEAAIAKGCPTVDAAVSGSTPQAQAGNLVVFAGGDEAIFNLCRPMFQTFGKDVFHMGPIGSGKMIKLVVNLLLGTNMQALAEAIALGQKAGLDKNRLLDVLGQTAVVAPAFKAKLENARTDQYPSTFGLALMCKDLNLIFRRAAEVSCALPATAAAQQVFVTEHARGVEEDFSAVIHAMEQAAGIGNR